MTVSLRLVKRNNRTQKRNNRSQADAVISFGYAKANSIFSIAFFKVLAYNKIAEQNSAFE